MSKMKDSGIEWIGKIPSNHSLLRLDMLTQCIKGKKPLNDNTEGIGLPCIGASEMNGAIPTIFTEEDLPTCKPNDILILWDGANAGLVASGLDGIVASTVARIRLLSSDYNCRFVYYVYKAAERYYKEKVGGTTIPHMNSKYLKETYILNFNLAEQQCIADFLDRKCAGIDDVLRKTRASIEEYKRLKQAIITEVVTKGIRGRRAMTDSGIEWIGMIPNTWHCRKIGNLFKYIGGYAFDSKTFQSEGCKQVLRIGNIKDDIIIESSNDVFIPTGIADTADKCRIKVGQILFTMTGTKGKGDYFYTVCINEEDVAPRDRYINQRVGAFEAKTELIPEYFNYVLKLTRVRQRVFLNETGTANQGNIGIEDLYRIALPVPPIDEQQEIAKYLAQKSSEIDSLIASKDALIKNLETYRKSLIYEYVTGKKEVTA